MYLTLLFFAHFISWRKQENVQFHDSSLPSLQWSILNAYRHHPIMHNYALEIDSWRERQEWSHSLIIWYIDYYFVLLKIKQKEKNLELNNNDCRTMPSNFVLSCIIVLSSGRKGGCNYHIPQHHVDRVVRCLHATTYHWFLQHVCISLHLDIIFCIQLIIFIIKNNVK